MIQRYSISGLYYNYNRRKNLTDLMENIKVVLEKDNMYYSFNEQWKIISRKTALSFHTDNISTEPELNLKEYKTITYLVKSSSRFILKPDIGEILDQIELEDLSGVKAICYLNGYELLPDTEGEHFLMKAKLLK